MCCICIFPLRGMPLPPLQSCKHNVAPKDITSCWSLSSRGHPGWHTEIQARQGELNSIEGVKQNCLPLLHKSRGEGQDYTYWGGGLFPPNPPFTPMLCVGSLT